MIVGTLSKVGNRNIVFAIVALIIIGGGAYYFIGRDDTPSVVDEALPTPSTQEQIEGVFDIQIPENVEKVELESRNEAEGSVLATRDTGEDRFEHTVLADLDTPEGDEYYQAWLSNGEDYIATGSLRQAKGGWIVEYDSQSSLEDYNKVIISLENSPTTEPGRILFEGSFE